MACVICETRRARRFCPGVSGDICTICCGTEREVTVSCPLDCEYLRDARKHDKPVPVDMDQVPNREIKVSESFLSGNEGLLLFLSQALAEAALEIPGAVDFDVREALESLIRTYRTLQSGLYYESAPANPLAGGIYSAIQAAAEKFRAEERQRLGISKTRDSDLLGLLVFLQRVELDRNNGRKRGRAFIDYLTGISQTSGSGSTTRDTTSLILP